MSRRWLGTSGIAVAALIAGAVLAWRLAGDERRRPRPAARGSRLDVAAFRAQLAARAARARRLAAATAAHPTSAAPTGRASIWDAQGKGRLSVMALADGECWFGSPEACDAVAPVLAACDGGDARSCLALGDALAEPPTLSIAAVYYYAACRIGDADGCERLDDSARPPCAEDLWRCMRHALNTQDRRLFEEACALGAAEACSWLAWKAASLDEELAYMESACQLGLAPACKDLARRASAVCPDDDDDDEATHCLPLDDDGAARARQLVHE